MKSASVFMMGMIFLLQNSCIRKHENFFLSKNKNKIIAIQPVDYYDTARLSFIRDELSHFYQRKVIILKPITIPESFNLRMGAELYSADSLLDMLSGKLTYEIIEVIGITHKDIYMLKNPSENPLLDYRVQPIFGLADFFGDCGIVSDFRLFSIDSILFNHRLRTVVIHEIGHNIGLDHCSFDRCIMSDQNAKLSAIDSTGNDYCNDCKKKLQN
jgi:archaemetzincin